MRARFVWASIAAVCLPLAVAVEARAQPVAGPSAAERENARSLMVDGRAKLEAGDAVAAEKAFAAAHAIMGVPTTGLDLARAQAALGKLIEARDLALQVTRMPKTLGEAAAFAKARKTAQELADALTPRIGAVVVSVTGPADRATLEVRLDGAPLVAAALDLPWKVNPGAHVVTARAASFADAEMQLEVGEGETKPVAIAMTPAPIAADATPAVAPPATAPETAPAPVWPWVVGGVGVAVVATGVGLLVDFALVQRTISKSCSGGVCDPNQLNAAEVSALEAHRNRSGIAGIACTAGGGALLIAGIVGLAVRPRPNAPATAVRVTPFGLGLAASGDF
jgi:hypothetical protein